MSKPETRYPSAIREAAAQADAIDKQLRSGNAPAEPAPPAAPAAPEAPPAAPATPAPAEPALSAEEQLAKLQQQHKSLQGIHASQQERIRAQQEEITRLNADLAQVQLPQRTDEGVDQANLAKMREGFGAELAETLDARVRSIVTDVLRTHLEPMQNVMKSSVGREQARIEDVFFEQLGLLVPSWRDLNNDPGFLAWLNQIDPAAGVPLIALLRDAEDKKDARRAAVFFNAYERERAAASRPEPAAQPQTQRPGAPQPTVAKTFTAAQIEQHFLDRQRGKFRGREAEADAIEAEFMIAQREGRIVR